MGRVQLAPDVHSASRYRRKVHGEGCPECREEERKHVARRRQGKRDRDAAACGAKLLICRLGCDAAFETEYRRNCHERYCD